MILKFLTHIFLSIILPVALLVLLVWSIKGLVQNIREFIESRKIMWKMMFNKDNKTNFKNNLIKIKSDSIKCHEVYKLRKEQKKHRNMWNKALEERDKNKK